MGVGEKGVGEQVPIHNYRSRNLIGHYPFWVISPRPFLAKRRAGGALHCAKSAHVFQKLS